MKQRVPRTKKPFGSIEGEGCRKKGLVMGIDAHKSILACCIVNQEGIIHEKNYNNTKDSISQIVALSIKKGVESIGVEATSTYHLKIVFAFLDEGIEIVLANPIQLKSTQGKKTDKLDARRIAFALRDGRISLRNRYEKS